MRKIAIQALLVLLLFIPLACQRDLPQDPELGGDSSLATRSGHQFISTTDAGNSTETQLTEVGVSRDNPYTVQNFRAAYQDLYGVAPPSMPVTDYYLKFIPGNLQEMKALAQSDLNLYEYPLEKEVIRMGEYYMEPGTGMSQWIPMYAVVKVGQALPAVPYIKLADLHLRSRNEALVRKALERKGYDPDGTGYIIPPEDPGDGGDGSGGGTGTGGGGGGSSDYETNACGCMVYKDQRKPGGCVQVWDVEKARFEGVRRVKVILKDTWFTEDEVWTDEQGCFRLNNRYKGKAWMWIKFQSNTLRIRGARSGFVNTAEWLHPVKDFVGSLNGPRFNNIEVQYGMWTQQGSSAHLYWGAATVNNAVHEFHTYAMQEGIYPPPNELDIIVSPNRAGGTALMAAKNPLSDALGVALSAAAFVTDHIAPLINILGWATARTYLPDVLVGIDFGNSDRLKRLTYHELAHASHSLKAGPLFWEQLALSEAIAGGHGNANSINAGLIAITEAWAEHIALSFAHRAYGPDNSITGTYLSTQEETKNESADHIPIGFFHDLIDAAPDTQNACDQDGNDCGPIDDQVSSYSNAQMFSLLNISTTSPAIFRDKLLEGVPIDLRTRVNNLFNCY